MTTNYITRLDVSVTNLLLEQDDVQLNEADNKGWTLLHAAARNRYLSTVRLWLCKGSIKPELVDNTGLTALAWATKNKHTDIANILRRYVKSKR